ncbi:monooxygenase [Acidimicrobiaceae bacterium USS-CC1]|uniref:Monooxygenase n=1 Tax=Acidiferrimicrobium australe TaxID=2664430 RepID=A0ABW9QPN3_9ACTN|nr:monooxygenase [Acidiferrimicrobium australe]
MTKTDSSPFRSDPTASGMCGCTIMNNQDGYVIAALMRGKPGVTVTEFPSMIRIDAVGTLVFDFDEIGEALGYGDDEPFSQANLEEVMSTHYGRMINLDDRTVFFANPEDAADYIGFDLAPAR